MDWNGDGKTTIAEVMEASDIVHRPGARDGKRCVDYYSYKDGLTIRMDCPR